MSTPDTAVLIFGGDDAATRAAHASARDAVGWPRRFEIQSAGGCWRNLADLRSALDGCTAQSVVLLDGDLRLRPHALLQLQAALGAAPSDAPGVELPLYDHILRRVLLRLGIFRSEALRTRCGAPPAVTLGTPLPCPALAFVPGAARVARPEEDEVVLADRIPASPARAHRIGFEEALRARGEGAADETLGAWLHLLPEWYATERDPRTFFAWAGLAAGLGVAAGTATGQTDAYARTSGEALGLLFAQHEAQWKKTDALAGSLTEWELEPLAGSLARSARSHGWTLAWKPEYRRPRPRRAVEAVLRRLAALRRLPSGRR